ncbi:MAG: MBL fold metallo-hydrolase [Candidatus Bathyarchaeia archaeon]
MRIKWENGVVVEYKGDGVVLDPQTKRLNYKAAFITHAHVDHSHAFKIRHIPKFSSNETMHLVTVSGTKTDNWRPLSLNEKIAIGDIEVMPRSSGHVLGSYEFEIATPNGTVLFTGDMNTRQTRLVKPAEPVNCDVLVIESTYGSPDFVFPSDDIVAEEMISWAGSVLREGRVPVFCADHIGNAQEVIRIFNENSSIPVVSHWRVSRVNRVYEAFGHKIEYIDINDEEAQELISRHNAVIVAPKNINSLSFDQKYVSAIVSGWALKLRHKSFPLSDHADFPNLMDFIRECSPKLVLTYHGGRFNEVLARHIEKKLRIRSYPINLIATNFLPI